MHKVTEFQIPRPAAFTCPAVKNWKWAWLDLYWVRQFVAVCVLLSIHNCLILEILPGINNKLTSLWFVEQAFFPVWYLLLIDIHSYFRNLFTEEFTSVSLMLFSHLHRLNLFDFFSLPTLLSFWQYRRSELMMTERKKGTIWADTWSYNLSASISPSPPVWACELTAPLRWR